MKYKGSGPWRRRFLFPNSSQSGLTLIELLALVIIGAIAFTVFTQVVMPFLQSTWSGEGAQQVPQEHRLNF